MSESIKDETPTLYVTKSELKNQFGLSDKWITRLGAPDKQLKNPNYRSGPPMSLYSRQRVLDFIIENAEEYAVWQEKRQRLSAAQIEVQRKKREINIEWAKNVEIKAMKLPKDLMETARNYFADRDFERGFYDLTPKQVNFRGVLAYLRHQKTNYDELCLELVGKTGTAEAYSIVAERVRVHCVLLIVQRYGVEFILERVKELENKYPNLTGVIEAVTGAPNDGVPIPYDIQDFMLPGGLEAYELARALMIVRGATRIGP